MSRRFGRNQKRRLRAQLAEQQASFDMQRTLLAYAQERRAVVERKLAAIEDAARRLRYCGLLPPVKVTLDPPERRWAIDAASICEAPPVVDENPAELTTGTWVDLYALAVEIIERPELFARDVHFIAQGSGPLAGTWAYRVSERMLAAGIRPDVRQKFVETVTHRLLDRAEDHFIRQGKRHVEAG